MSIYSYGGGGGCVDGNDNSDSDGDMMIPDGGDARCSADGDGDDTKAQKIAVVV